MISSIQRFLGVVYQEGGLAGLELATMRLGAALAGRDRVYFALVRMTDRYYDWRTGLDTGGIMQQAEIQIDPSAGRHYMGVAPRAWRLLIGHLPIEPGLFTYVDLGCGKGRTLLLAADRGFRHVIGVDLSDQMVRIAQKNAEKAGHRNIEVLHMNALKYEFPASPLIIFLYNPFWKNVMERVATNLEESLKREPREVYLVYLRPAFREVWDSLGSLALYRQCDAAYPWYAIYRSTW